MKVSIANQFTLAKQKFEVFNKISTFQVYVYKMAAEQSDKVSGRMLRHCK